MPLMFRNIGNNLSNFYIFRSEIALLMGANVRPSPSPFYPPIVGYRTIGQFLVAVAADQNGHKYETTTKPLHTVNILPRATSFQICAIVSSECSSLYGRPDLRARSSQHYGLRPRNTDVIPSRSILVWREAESSRPGKRNTISPHRRSAARRRYS